MSNINYDIQYDKIGKSYKALINMGITNCNISDYLDDKEMISEYLNTVLEEGNSSEIIVAIGHIAKAIGMSKIAEVTGLSRPDLYKALSADSRPQFDTILKVLRAVGGHLNVNLISA